jgi:tRNA dimethylallyltransferase
MNPFLLVLGGPTASGKSSLALEVAKRFRAGGKEAEILCADSITVYKDVEIGATKPSPEERSLVPHHLLDLVAPGEDFTAADFLRLADSLISRLLAQGKYPVLVGGSGFYLRALLRGMASPEEKREESAELKQKLEERARSEGWEKLYQELLSLDPAAAAIVHPNDHYRVIRALQFMALSGEKAKWSEQNKRARLTPPRYPMRYFRLESAREPLRRRIEERTRIMLERGLVEEVEMLLKKGVPATAKPLQSVGYKECVQFLQGKIPRDELQERITQSTARLAKAQATWFRGEELAEALQAPYLENLEKALLV